MTCDDFLSADKTIDKIETEFYKIKNEPLYKIIENLMKYAFEEGAKSVNDTDDIKILAYDSKGNRYTFSLIEKASEYTGVSVNHILDCIETGNRYKTYLFDEV